MKEKQRGKNLKYLASELQSESIENIDQAKKQLDYLATLVISLCDYTEELIENTRKEISSLKGEVRGVQMKMEESKVGRSIKCKLGWHLPHIVSDLNIGEKYSYCDRCQKELWRKKLEMDPTCREELIEKFSEAEVKIKREKLEGINIRAYCNQCQAYELFEFLKGRVFRCTTCGKDYLGKATL